MPEKQDEQLITTPKFRVSFAKVFKPEVNPKKPDDKPRYKLCMIFGPDADLTEMKQRASKALIDKFGADGVAKMQKLNQLKNPFHSGEEKDYEGYDDDTTFVNVSTTRRPGIVGPDGKTYIEVESDFYSGCYARATLTVYAFDKDGGRGVAFGLRNLQKIADGEPLGGSATAADEDFDAVDGYVASEANGDDAVDSLF